MNLEPGWEKKALIVLAVITLILIIYGFGSSKINANNTTNQSVENPGVAPGPSAVPTGSPGPNNVSTVNSNQSVNNTTAQVNGTNKVPNDQKGSLLIGFN